MNDLRIPDMPADLLDHLILDTCELERVAGRLIESLDGADLGTVPEGRVAVQLLEMLARMGEAGRALHRLADHRLKSVAAALVPD